MIIYKTDEEIELIRKSCLLVCDTLAHVAQQLRPGITGKTIDTAAEEFIRSHQAEPGFKGYRGFPGTLCISANEQVVHGIPTEKAFQEGDIVSIDCGVLLNGFYGDAAYTFILGEIEETTMQLLTATNTSLYLAIAQAKVGNRLGDISFAVQDYCERKHPYSVVRELVGHGIGRSLHEAPEVPNYGRRGRGPKLKEGLVIAIEPMINLGRKNIMQSDDGWSIITKDKKPSAHYEHTIAVRKQEVDILSNHTPIEQAIKQNPHLTSLPQPQTAESV